MATSTRSQRLTGRRDRPLRLPWVLLFLGLAGMGGLTARAAEPEPREAGFNAERSFEYLLKVCRLGPRISGSAGMNQQQKLLSEHFTRLDARVRFQSFEVAHPLHGTPVRMSNLIVHWQPERRERVLLACHYDTRPLPDRDPNPALARRGEFLGANDGASGVALFMELGHHMSRLHPTFGVDFIFFDGEELIYNVEPGRERGEWFQGSTYFAKAYRDTPPEYRYVWGILVDMIGDKNLQIHQEINSLKYAPELTASIWKTAKQLGVREYVPQPKYEVRDDHLPLNTLARIPTCDLIDFDFPAWHTTRDTPAACSGASLAKTGRVLLAWLESAPAPRE